MNRRILFTLLILAVCTFSALGQDARSIARSVFPSVVMLEMRDDAGDSITLGSGFFVQPDVVVTNYHVVEGASSGTAKIIGRADIFEIEGTVGFDKSRDLILLKLKGIIGKPLPLGDFSKIEVGQEVFALGNPHGLEGTISPGIISGNSLRKIGKENLIQITAPISPGSSGGPVVNRDGQVIGVAVASLEDGQNLNFAIPSSYVALLLADSVAVTPISTLKKPSEKNGNSEAGPTLEETTSWLTNKLVGQTGKWGDVFIRKIEDLTFDHCSMDYLWTAVKPSSVRGFMIESRVVLQLSSLDTVLSKGNYITLGFGKSDG